MECPLRGKGKGEEGEDSIEDLERMKKKKIMEVDCWASLCYTYIFGAKRCMNRIILFSLRLDVFFLGIYLRNDIMGYGGNFRVYHLYFTFHEQLAKHRTVRLQMKAFSQLCTATQTQSA